MKRREFITLLGGAAAAWPFAARAQQPMPVIGFLRSASLDNAAPLVSAFRQGLKEAGYIEGQNVAVEFRSAEGRNDQLPGLVAELVRLQVAVIVCNVTAASAAKAVTSTVPIVFATGDDPIAEGLVVSLNRPGGNITGVSFLGNALGAKQVELLHELLPRATTIAVLVDTNYQGSVSGLTDVEAAAHSLGQQLVVLHASSERDLDLASATLAQQRADAVIVLGQIRKPM
jgi:putative tryptophan/tyrosine transport system substrate-binding protein